MSKTAEANMNEFFTIDDIPLSQDEKEMVLEWYARKLWEIILNAIDDDSHCKSYDPLVIDGNVAHSYVFDLDDGERHHEIKSLHDLESQLTSEVVKRILYRGEQ